MSYGKNNGIWNGVKLKEEVVGKNYEQIIKIIKIYK